MEEEMNPFGTDMEEETKISENRETVLQMPQLTQMEIEEEIHPSGNIEVNLEEPEPSDTTPCLDLLHGSRKDYFRYCVPLFQASIAGNWDAAQVIINKRPELVRYAITEDYNTPLHVAASAGTTKLMVHFMHNLIERMDRADWVLKNRDSNTALSLAAAAGNVEIARIMISKDSTLLNIRGNDRSFPLYAAADNERGDMVRYLYGDDGGSGQSVWTPTEIGRLLEKCVECDIFDVALKIVNKRIHNINRSHESVLRTLARKPDALYTVKRSFIKRITRRAPDEMDSDALRLLKIVWKTIVREKSKQEVDLILRGPLDPALITPSRILFVAAEAGNTRFLVELLQAYPDLAWEKNDDNLSIFHIAIMHRHQGIFNLIYEIGSLKDQIIHLKDKYDNNMLHLVGKTSKEMRPHMAEASLVMQRELLWFKAVEKQLPPMWRKRKNQDGQTPYELFAENNKDVVSEGLKWMKHCMVVATLIVTVAFAVAFTVPGGYSQDYGRPYFLYRSTFTVFVIADSICLVSSSASLLMFLSILTSRYNQDHFLYSLPKKLVVALFFLFISVVAMMVTFSASFFVLYHNGLRWVAFVIAGFVAIPVVIFAMLQIPVLVDVCRSVYDNRYLFNPRSNTLYFAKREHIVRRVARSVYNNTFRLSIFKL